MSSLSFSAAAATVPSSKQQGLHLRAAGTDFVVGIPQLSKQVYFCPPRRAGSTSQFKFRIGLANVVWKSSVAEVESKEEDDESDDWESAILEDFERPTGRIHGREGQCEGESSSLSRRGEEELCDWSSKARERAMRSIQERELPVSALLENGKKRKKMKKKKTMTPHTRLTKAKLEKMSRVPDEKKLPTDHEIVQAGVNNSFMANLGSLNNSFMANRGGSRKGLAALGDYWETMGSNIAGELREADGGTRQGNADDVPRQDNEEMVLREFSCRMASPASRSVSSSGYSTPSRQKRQEDFDLNRSLVGAAHANEVLSLIADVIEDRVWGLPGCPLSSFNISTALHRIAKHMETSSMNKSDRLSFARKKVMAQLVSAAMESLPQCTAQSISNIAWALSKVGGYAMYGTEMDLISQFARKQISNLNPQHIANIAGALASMQHSIPPLFEALDVRASFYHYELLSQELAQLLWAFATLNQPAMCLLDFLDSECGSILRERREGSLNTQLIVGADDMQPCQLSGSFLDDDELESQLVSPQVADKAVQVRSSLPPDSECEVESQRP